MRGKSVSINIQEWVINIRCISFHLNEYESTLFEIREMVQSE